MRRSGAYYLLYLPIVGLGFAASAADLPQLTPPMMAFAPLVTPSFTWTGPYAGVFFGYGSLDESGTGRCIGPRCVRLPALSPGARAADLSAGSEVGYNLQASPGSGLVIGAAVDYQTTRLRGYGESILVREVDENSDFAAFYHLGQRLDTFGAVRGKAGYAFDRLFVYGTGGLAYGYVRIDVGTALTVGDRQFAAQGLTSGFRLGYAAGGGAEYAISPHLSVKAEGLYYDLGQRTVSIQAALPRSVYGGTIATHGFLARASLNYRFGDGIPGLGLPEHIRTLLNPVAYTPLPASDWVFEVGIRYFYSTGRSSLLLGDSENAGHKNSRVIYHDVGAHASENFVRVDDNSTGRFAKAFVGSGIITSGRFTDEDFPPRMPLYSHTISKIPGRDIGYAVADVGYNVLVGETYRLGAFAGYQYVSEFADSSGCAQKADNSTCGWPFIPRSVEVVTHDMHWHGMRIGLAGELRYDRLKLSAEAAYLPIADLSGFDHHWLRPDINPLPVYGLGNGYFLQGVVSYDLTPEISIGVGARYWKMVTDRGHTKFPYAEPSALPTPLKYESSRAGVFVQASYKFTDNSFDLGPFLR
ncbi:hypothetical protein M446_7000 (plasmid) [Methylobacterium sp. 4-46]|nr:hypothetical protein M446_7000 [Methylobacterium sp. 4-46]